VLRCVGVSTCALAKPLSSSVIKNSVKNRMCFMLA
jgi:hypothetical protein